MGKGGARLGKKQKGALLYSTTNVFNFLNFNGKKMIIDTREEHEYIEAHILGAYECALPHLRANKIDLKTFLEGLDEKGKKMYSEKKESRIVVCGNREKRAMVMHVCELLVKAGASRVAYFEDIDKFVQRYPFLVGRGKDTGNFQGKVDIHHRNDIPPRWHQGCSLPRRMRLARIMSRP
ncbi:hypothetical protein AAMO2058_000326000 [Amorphochlora amoebiformis]